MCGVAGILALANPGPDSREIVRRMMSTMVHRGPDGEGLISSGRCTLGFRRLAIVDLEAAAPPFSNEDGSIWSVCNGEIYNSPKLRQRLEAEGHRFETLVDTEVIPHLWEKSGQDLVDELNGMFALAVWDERRGTLLLARDRAGEKPLFYWHDSQELVFASELGALLAHPRVPRELDPVALRRYLLHGFFPAPLTPLADIHKLPAGAALTVRSDRISHKQYWDLADHLAPDAIRSDDPERLADELDERLAVAVRERRRSDVPVGVFLSGGLDSSTILAHYAEQQGPGVPVFSLGHQDQDFDEARFAEETAHHFDADYHQLILGEADLAEGLRLVGEKFDEPLADASIIPTHLLAKFARQKVKVILSGEGADELFGGYPTYFGNRIADGYQKIPGPLRRLSVATLRKLTPHSMGNVGIDYLLERFLSAADCDRLERHHRWFGCLSPERISDVLSEPVSDQSLPDASLASARQQVASKNLRDPLSELLYTDFTMYLAENLLTKVDRCTMLVSLEARAPFLDHELAEFVASLPSNLKVHGTKTKAILRQVAAKRLPKSVLQRRKRGFNIPLSRWLLHGLGKQLEDRFSQERVTARGLLDPAAVGALLDEHLARSRDHRKPLFALLALDLWCDRTFGEGTRIPIRVGAEPR
jgi:asparagine synthase (glutamine-hydrolysing)